MNITVCPLQYTNDSVTITCPGCQKAHYHHHGSYQRKGFHKQNNIVTIPLSVPRYRCINPECSRCTFSVLPPLVLRYCRFFWPCLLEVWRALNSGATVYHLAKHVWSVGRGVITRAVALRSIMHLWVEKQHQELTNGRAVREPALMVKIITIKLGRIGLIDRWYHHRYPLRFYAKKQ